jgi:hypothetical protein
MIGVSATVTRIAATPPATGRSAQVATDDAVMWAMVTPIMAVESSRSGLRNASRYRIAVRFPPSAMCRRRTRLAAMNDISAAEKSAVTSRESPMIQT